MVSPRVLVIGLNFAPEPTGIAPYTTGFAHGLSDRGFDARVITTFPHYPEWRVADGWHGLTRREDRDGIAVTRLRHYVPSTPSGLRRAVSEVSFGLRAVTAGWGDPDLVICASPALLATTAAQVRARGRRRRPAVGVVVQDLYSAGVIETGSHGAAVVRALSKVEGLSLRAADGVVAIHPRFKARMVQSLGLESGSVTVIRNWTHVAAPLNFDRAALRDRYGWSAEEFVALHTGAMGEKQALTNVVDAARLADSVRAPVRFALVGDGGQRARLMQEADGIERIQFLSPVSSENYAGLLGAADVLLVNERPGVNEMAVPSKLTSYFSSGRPVIAATEATSTTAEEIAAAGAGVRVEPGNPRYLLDEVMCMAGDAARCRELGARGPAYCASVLSEEVALDAYAEWATELLGFSNGKGVV